MTSRVKHNSAGLRAAPGAGRGAVQETREHLFLCDRGDCCLAAAGLRLTAFACAVRLGRTSHHNVPSNCCTTTPTRDRPRMASAVSPRKNPCNGSVSYSPMNLRSL